MFDFELSVQYYTCIVVSQYIQYTQFNNFIYSELQAQKTKNKTFFSRILYSPEHGA